MRYLTVPFKWMPLVLNGTALPDHSLSQRVEKRMGRFYHKWQDTPYVSGQMMSGPDGGTDCIRFLAAFVSCMTGQDTKSEDLPLDSAMTTKHGSFIVMKQILRRYPTMKPLKNLVGLQPGDVLCVGHEAGGPSHCLIVGHKENTLWHAIQGAGVCRTGWSLMEEHMQIFRIYRFTDRNEWGRSWSY